VKELKLQVYEKKLVKRRLTCILEAVQFGPLNKGKVLYFMLVKYYYDNDEM